MCPCSDRILYLIHDFILSAIQLGFKQMLCLKLLAESVDYEYIFYFTFRDHVVHENVKTVD